MTRGDANLYRFFIYFNPHEREARDYWFALQMGRIVYFNPHEREARDKMAAIHRKPVKIILIHTSVKLVTSPAHRSSPVQEF